MSIIDDGTGSGKQAKVGVKNRLHTHSLSVDLASIATQDGDAFDVSAATVTLTTANESALLYIENNEDLDIAIVTEFINQGASTGGSGPVNVKFYLNPTGGTLISAASAATSVNRRIGDNAGVALTALQGVEGSTITGGTVIDIPGSGAVLPSEFVLAKGNSFAISYTPPAGNTSQPVAIAVKIIKDYPDYTVN